MKHSLLLLVIVGAASSFVDAAKVLSKGEDGIQMLRNIAEKMESAAPPPNIPVELRLGAYINSFYTLNEQSMDFGVSWYLRMAWQDERLAFTPKGDITTIKAPDGYWDSIWTPDVFLRNEKSANIQSLISPHRLLKVNATGHVWYVVKMSATLTCQMNLQKFPMDTQSCPVMFESFGYTMDVLQFNWLDEPIQVDEALQLPTFKLVDTVLHNCSQTYTAGSFPCLEVSFILERDIGYYVMQVFIPSIILVIISWLQFYLSADAVTGRVLVGLFSTFTLVAQLTGIRASLPKISYMTAIDIWMTVCLLFIFGTLLELALVQLMNRKKDGREASESQATSKLDAVSRLLFPVLFLIFLIAYWASFGSG